MSEELTHITDTILDRFEQLNRIPRKSKHEERIGRWLAEWADSHGFDRVFDHAANLIVRVPGTEGRESEPAVILQGHMDMVCEKTPESDHDFSTDPIAHVIDGEWLSASGTTLGADNGIALAYAMVAATELSHPPLELLFTVDEETGLTGARNLDGSLLHGRTLINLDSEDEGVITIGCAGGCDGVIEFALADGVRASATGLDPSQNTPIRVVVGGLSGGHSGVDIDRQRGNANRILARVLDALLREPRFAEAVRGFNSLAGGSARNAIPRDSEITLLFDRADAGAPDAMRAMQSVIEQIADELRAELAGVDDRLTISTTEGIEPSDDTVIGSVEELIRLVRLLLALPHGVQRMSGDGSRLVESSCNLALCETRGPNVRITTSQRSSRDTRIVEMTRRIEAVARLAGAGFSTEHEYPAWQPNRNAELLKRAVSVYRDLFGRDPVVEVIHAGLECAVIGTAIPGVDMISIGPTIKDAHSPDERLFLPSIGSVWRYLEALLA